jgi:Xaa-Pro aminopeptidase
VVVSNPINIRYLTGFVASASMLVCTADDAWLLTDGRYTVAARRARESGAIGPVRIEPVARRYDITLAELVGTLGLRRVGFEGATVTVSTARAWQQASPAVEWVATDGIVERLRLIKDEWEIAALRRAGGVLSDVASGIRSLVAEGRSERDVARDIEAAMERAGFEAAAFPTIVAAGPNSALPHARPTDRRLAPGDLVVLDFGGVLDGYCVDLTRMAGVGPLRAESERLVAAVHEAQAAALAAIRPGVAGSAVDAAARSLLDARGFGAAFLHSTGHGLGLEVHEAPRLARVDAGAPGISDTLEVGMVCTVEPGAYVEDIGGARLEDDILVTSGGFELLTHAPRNLVVV